MPALDNVLKRIEQNEGLHKIGLRLQNRIRLSVIRQRIFDHGLLASSVRYRVEGNTLTVGVGARYAKFHEFGTKPSIKMARWIFANLIGRGNVKKPSKGVIQWTGRGPFKKANIKARPFFWPTIDGERDYIHETLRSIYLGKK